MSSEERERRGRERERGGRFMLHHLNEIWHFSIIEFYRWTLLIITI